MIMAATNSLDVAVAIKLNELMATVQPNGIIGKAPLAQPEAVEDLEEPKYTPEVAVDMMEPDQAPPTSPAKTTTGSMASVDPVEDDHENRNTKCGIRLRWLSIYLLHLGTLIMPSTKLVTAIFVTIWSIYEDASCDGEGCPKNGTRITVGAISPWRAHYMMLACIHIVALVQFACGSYMFLSSCMRTTANLYTTMQVYCGFTAFEILSSIIYFMKMKASNGMVLWMATSFMISFLAISVTMYYPPPSLMHHFRSEGVGRPEAGPQGREQEPNGTQIGLNEGHGERIKNDGIENEGIELEEGGEQNIGQGMEDGNEKQQEDEEEQNGE